MLSRHEAQNCSGELALVCVHSALGPTFARPFFSFLVLEGNSVGI